MNRSLRPDLTRHAGYAYSGPAAAWAYRCLDLSEAYRVHRRPRSCRRVLTSSYAASVSFYSVPPTTTTSRGAPFPNAPTTKHP